MAGRTVTGRSPARTLTTIPDSPEITQLIAELEGLRWTGRKGYPIRSLVGACLAKSPYAIPTWSRTAALIAEHTGLQEARGGCPSVYACYRFATKLRKHRPLLDACLERVTASLRNQIPEYGEDIAIDASDLAAYANGQRYLSKHGPERERFSDPDASWGHRSAISTRKGGGFYGYKLHAAVCARTDLPISWIVKTAKTHESSAVFRSSHYVRPQPSSAVPISPPECEHGEWMFAGADFPHKRTKWRCPTGGCSPKSHWRKASRLHPLIPRETSRWRALYRARAAVEREFGRLKHDYGLAPLRVRGIERAQLHTDLAMLAALSAALARARAIPLAA